MAAVQASPSDCINPAPPPRPHFRCIYCDTFETFESEDMVKHIVEMHNIIVSATIEQNRRLAEQQMQQLKEMH